MTKDELLTYVKGQFDTMQYILNNCQGNVLSAYYALRNDLNNVIDDYFVQFMKNVQE